MYCIHEACKGKSRILERMVSVLDHNGNGHKVVDIAHLIEFVNGKYNEVTIQRM
jgi:hypothetical protein